jgi:hypothetical protein
MGEEKPEEELMGILILTNSPSTSLLWSFVVFPPFFTNIHFYNKKSFIFNKIYVK